MTTKSKTRGKKLAQAAIAGTLTLGILLPIGTMTGWKAGNPIVTQERTITSGELGIEHGASTSAWTLNGAPISADALAAVSLVPGDTVAYTGTETPRVVGDNLEGFMYLEGLDSVESTLASSPAASLAWSVDGKQEAKTLTQADHLVAQDVTFAVTMKPISDPVYDTAGVGQGLTLDLSKVKVAVSMINPGGASQTPEVVAESVDLIPALSGPVPLTMTTLGLPVARIDAYNTLTVSNLGTAPSTGTETATLVYNPELLTINTAFLGVPVTGSPGSYTLTLPAIQPGDSLAINLSVAVNPLLNLNKLTGIIGEGAQAMDVTVSGDAVTANNYASKVVSITIH